jgi:hypothetical protein
VIFGGPRSPESAPGLYAGGAASRAEGDDWSARSSWPVTSKGHYLRWDGGLKNPGPPAPAIAQFSVGFRLSSSLESSAGAGVENLAPFELRPTESCRRPPLARGCPAEARSSRTCPSKTTMGSSDAPKTRSLPWSTDATSVHLSFLARISGFMG